MAHTLHIVLYQPEIPQNTGNIGRTCVAISAKLWLVRPLGFRLDDQRMLRAGLDYWSRLAWEAVADWQTLTQRLGGRRMWYFSARARRAYTDAEFQEGDCLVFGNETEGLPETICDRASRESLTIPTTGDVRSLNLSNCVAVAAFEAMRQIS